MVTSGADVMPVIPSPGRRAARPGRSPETTAGRTPACKDASGRSQPTRPADPAARRVARYRPGWRSSPRDSRPGCTGATSASGLLAGERGAVAQPARGEDSREDAPGLLGPCLSGAITRAWYTATPTEELRHV